MITAPASFSGRKCKIQRITANNTNWCHRYLDCRTAIVSIHKDKEWGEASSSKSKKSVDKAVDFDIKDYIVKTKQGIDLIPNGPTPPNPIELLASNNNEKVIAQLKKMYDIIIIDCTPVLGISDAIVMTKYSDANILVVSNKKTKLELVSRVEKIFSQSHASLTGVVINKVDVSEGGYYGYYSNSYYGESE